MAKLLLREALQISVYGSNQSVGHYGNGKQTYSYDDKSCATNEACYLRAKAIHADLKGHERQILDGSDLPGDDKLVNDEGLICV